MRKIKLRRFDGIGTQVEMSSIVLTERGVSRFKRKHQMNTGYAFFLFLSLEKNMICYSISLNKSFTHGINNR